MRSACSAQPVPRAPDIIIIIVIIIVDVFKVA